MGDANLIHSPDGKTIVVESGATVEFKSGSSLLLGAVDIAAGGGGDPAIADVTASADEINLNDDAPADVAFAIAAGSTNIAEITVTVKDAAGVAMARPVAVLLWLSDASTGLGLASAAPSGGIAPKSSNGTLLGTLTASKAIVCHTTAAGVVILQVTASGKGHYYVGAQVLGMPGGKVFASAQLADADYGA
jgi:hypothetical protein